MTQRDYTLSLSRWHTVATRLRASAEAMMETGLAVLGGTSVQHELSDAQIQALKQRGERALADINTARSSLRAVTKIRAALAVANANAGVTETLAEAEGLRAEMRQLEGLSQIDPLKQVEIDQANAAVRKNGEGNVRGYGMGVPVALVALNALDEITRDRAVLARRQTELMDQVNDRNRATLTLAIDEAVAAVAGL